MSLTRKHYVMLAEALSLVRPYGQVLNSAEMWRRCVDNIANVLAADNPAFDRARFVRACEGYTDSRDGKEAR